MGVPAMTDSPDYERFRRRAEGEIYRQLRTRRNKLTRDLETEWVYRHHRTGRTPEGDRLRVAWLNAEMNRRIWHNPLVSGMFNFTRPPNEAMHETVMYLCKQHSMNWLRAKRRLVQKALDVDPTNGRTGFRILNLAIIEAEISRRVMEANERERIVWTALSAVRMSEVTSMEDEK